MKSNALPVTIVGGYLGCGKTTLINHILRNCGDSQIAVLINDFGQLPIDADLIESRDGNIISLSGGCICCSYGNDLSVALMDIIDRQTSLDHLLIETSGVALPNAIASSLILFEQLQLHSILVLVNGETIREQIKDRYIGDTIQRQLENTDIIVVNKSDLIKSEDLQATYSWIQKAYPQSTHIITAQAMMPVDILLDVKPDQSAESHLHHNNTQPESAHDLSAFNSYTLDINGIRNLNALLDILKDKHLQLVRVKGYMLTGENQYTLIQIVSTRVHIHIVDKKPVEALIGKLACIALAHGITKQELSEILLHLK